jgi:hypothetical protein
MKDGCEHSTSGATDFGKHINHNSKFIYQLLMNSCKCESLIYVTAEVLNSCQGGIIASVAQGLFSKIMILR